MSLKFGATTATGRAYRTTGLVSNTSPSTHLACIRLDTDTDGVVSFIDLRRYGGTNTGHGINATSDGTSLRAQFNYGTNNTAVAATLTVGNWVWVVLRQTNTTGRVSVIAHDSATVVTQTATLTSAEADRNFIPTLLNIGAGDGGDYSRSTICHVRVWEADLSDSELLLEVASSAAVRSANLVSAHSFDGGSVGAAVVGETGADFSYSGDVTYVADAPTFGTNRRVKLLFDPAKLTSADTAITAYVWTQDPSLGLATKYEGLVGDATDGTLYCVPAPSGTTDGQSVTAVAFNLTDGGTYMAGEVEDY